MNLAQPWQDRLALRQIERCNDLPIFEPLIDPELLANIATFKDDEFLVKLFLEFSLPLESQVCRTYNETPLTQAAKLEFPDEQARHEGFPCTCIVGEEETHPRE